MIFTPTWDAGTEYTVANAPPGYETLHFGDRFSTQISLPDGDYAVNLRFIEPVVTAPGARIFHIWINDEPILTHIDIFNRVGFMVPMERRVEVSVAGGLMIFEFVTDVRLAVVSGITIEPLTNSLLTIG